MFSSLQNKLLGISTRRLLTENAIPTISPYTRPTQKRKTTKGRQSSSTKRQLIDDAILTNLPMEIIDKENLLIENSKLCQTEIAIPSVRSNPVKLMPVTLHWLKKMKTTLQLSLCAV